MQTSHILRDLTYDDEDFLWEMLYQAIYTPEGEPRPPREIIYQPELAKYARDWGKPGDLGIITVEMRPSSQQPGGKPAGAAWLRLFQANDPGYGFVSADTPELSIALLPDKRGKGLGAQLLLKLIEKARGKYPALSLSVSAGNPAVHLYRRFGFETVREEADSWVMLKGL